MAATAPTPTTQLGPPPVLRQSYRREKLGSALFLAPAVAFLMLTSVYPLLYSLWLSFHSWNMTIPNSKPVWIGSRNYESNSRQLRFPGTIRSLP